MRLVARLLGWEFLKENKHIMATKTPKVSNHIQSQATSKTGSGLASKILVAQTSTLPTVTAGKSGTVKTLVAPDLA